MGKLLFKDKIRVSAHPVGLAQQFPRWRDCSEEHGASLEACFLRPCLRVCGVREFADLLRVRPQAVNAARLRGFPREADAW